MRISKLIELLQKAANEHGDLPIHYLANGAEYSPAEVKLAKAGTSAAQVGAITGPHQFEPDRLVISGHRLS